MAAALAMPHRIKLPEGCRRKLATRPGKLPQGTRRPEVAPKLPGRWLGSRHSAFPPPPDLRGICGLIWAKSSQHCPTLSNVSRTLANFGQPRPNIHLFGPTLAKLDPTLSNFGQHRPLLAQLGQDCPPKPIAGEHWQNSGRSSAPAATSEQLWAMLGQLWGSPGVAFWNFREEV